MRGRPKVVVDEKQLKMLHNMNYTAKQMAEQFGCSPQLVYKRLYACGLSQRDKYSNMTSCDLDNIVDKTQTEFPNAGSVMLNGILQSKGLFVQRHRLRRSIERVNPIPVALRFAKTVSRRHYQVKMSNSLWHVDGHMKLVRWGISTHGGIDGFSRTVVFLSADTDNKAVTVLQHFVHACQQYGVPSRVRSDFGGENMMIALFMNMVNGENRHSHITGRSVHNQRIERLWRDVHTQVIQKYYNQFYSMEDQGELDPDNALHLLAVKFAFVPVINEELEVFRRGWNCHKISTENNHSPNQLWLNGILENINDTCKPIQNVFGPNLQETFEEKIRSFGLNPADFAEDAVMEDTVLSSEQAEFLKSMLNVRPQPSPLLQFRCCLSYFQDNNIQGSSNN